MFSIDKTKTMVRYKKCCVSNCTNKFARRHTFPKRYMSTFKQWVDIIKPPLYETLTTDQIYKKYLVCDDHFSNDCFVPGTKRGLKVHAIPTINIPGTDGKYKNFTNFIL